MLSRSTTGPRLPGLVAERLTIDSATSGPSGDARLGRHRFTNNVVVCSGTCAYSWPEAPISAGNTTR